VYGIVWEKYNLARVIDVWSAVLFGGCENVEDWNRADAGARIHWITVLGRILHFVDVDQSPAAGGVFSHDDERDRASSLLKTDDTYKVFLKSLEIATGLYTTD